LLSRGSRASSSIVQKGFVVAAEEAPRERALALLENFRRNLARAHSMALVGTLLSEEDRQPQLIARFRDRLVKPRSVMLGAALQAGVADGGLAPETDVDVVVSMLIGSFYG